MAACVTVYQHGGFAGRAQSFGIGRHDMDELEKIVGNDQVSSLRVQKGYKARLFEHADYKGREVQFYAGSHDISKVTGSGLENDSLSSLIVEKDEACVTVYQHSGFGGLGQPFGVGKHDMDELERTVGNDQVSSLRVKKGYKVWLFEDAGFCGTQAVFYEGYHDMCAMTESGFKNDSLSSLIVETDAECVTLYQHAGFAGKSYRYGMGYHGIDAIRITIGNDQVSSLKVKSGYEVRLFEHEEFGGKEVVFGPGDHDMVTLTSCGFENDILSSMIVQ